MKYLLDKNILSNNILSNITGRGDLCITEDVLDELGYTKNNIPELINAGINIIKLSKKHLEKLKQVMSKHGNNLKLINLLTGTGTADIVMIAIVLAEHEAPESLFSEEYCIITNDASLTKAAVSYGIKCYTSLPH